MTPDVSPRLVCVTDRSPSRVRPNTSAFLTVSRSPATLDFPARDYVLNWTGQGFVLLSGLEPPDSSVAGSV